MPVPKPTPASARSKMAATRAQARSNKGKLVESPTKPTDRTGGGKRKFLNPAKDVMPGKHVKAGQVKQENTMWVMPQKDPKTGKVTKRAYLAYRNTFEGTHVKDPATGAFRKQRRGDAVSGDVVIQKPGTTYRNERTSGGRGGQTGEKAYGPMQIAKYAGGRNINSPSMRKKLAESRVSAAKREQKPAAKRGK